MTRPAAAWTRQPEPRPCSYWLQGDERQWAVLPVPGKSYWEVCSFSEDGVELLGWVDTVAEGKRMAERDAACQGCTA